MQKFCVAFALAVALTSSAYGQVNLNVSVGASIDRNYQAGGVYSPAAPPCRPELTRCVEGTQWLAFFAAARSQDYKVLAIESYMVADQIPLLYDSANFTPAATTRVFFGNDFLNDYCYNGDNADAMANTVGAYGAGLYWAGSGGRITGRALAPLWTATPVDSIGVYTTANNASTPTTTTGASTYVAVGTQWQDSNLGTFVINVDGTDFGPFSNNGVNGHSVRTNLGLECKFGSNNIPCWQPGLAIVRGLSNTTHQVYVRSTSPAGQTVYVDYVAWGSNGAPMIALAPTRHAVGGYAANCLHPTLPPSDTTQAAYSAAKQALTTAAAGDGLNATFLDPQATVLDVNSVESATAAAPNIGVPKCFLPDREHLAGKCNAAYGWFIHANVASP